MNINELQKEIHDNAKSKGWWETKRPIPELLCLIHSEVSEAFEAYDNSNDNFEEELADILIRALDMASGYSINIDLSIFLDDQVSDHEFTYAQNHNVYRWLNVINFNATTLLEIYRKTSELDRIGLVQLISSLFATAQLLGIDIVREAYKKHEINKGGPYRHGNKVC